MSATYAPAFRLKRNGTVIATWIPPFSDVPNTSPASIIAGTASRAFLDTPGGAAVYTLEYLAGYDPAAFDANNAVHRRSILVQGVQQT